MASPLLVSYKLPVRPRAVALTGQCTGALVDEDDRLLMFALDAHLGKVVLLQRWLKGPLALCTEARETKPLKTCLARNAPVCVSLYGDRTLWVSREDLDGPREVLCGRGALGIAAISPLGHYVALEVPREGLRIVDISSDLVVSGLHGATSADFPNENTLVYSVPLFEDEATLFTGYEIRVQEHFAELQQGNPAILRCNEPLEPINLHARHVNSGGFCICVTLVKVTEGDAISTRVAVYRYLDMGVIKPESDRAYRDFVAEAMPLPDSSLAVHWPARGGFLLQQASRAYPLATTEPVQRGNVVAWAAEDSFFLMEYKL